MCEVFKDKDFLEVTVETLETYLSRIEALLALRSVSRDIRIVTSKALRKEISNLDDIRLNCSITRTSIVTRLIEHSANCLLIVHFLLILFRTANQNSLLHIVYLVFQSYGIALFSIRIHSTNELHFHDVPSRQVFAQMRRSELVSISLSNCLKSADHVRCLSIFFSIDGRWLEEICLNDHNTGNVIATELCKLLSAKYFPVLKNLSMAGNDLDDDACIRIVEVTSNEFHSFSRIGLERNRVTDAFADFIVDSIHLPEELDVSSCLLTLEASRKLRSHSRSSVYV